MLTRCDLTDVTYYEKDGIEFGNTQAGSPKWERNDCAVVTVSIVTDQPYWLIHEIFRMLGRRNKDCIQWDYFIANSPFRWRRVTRKRATLKKFVKRYPKGRYVALIRPYGSRKPCHVFALVDGTVYDCDVTSPNSYVYESWKCEGFKKGKL